jgi:phenylacetic acid degradation protein
MSNIFEFDGVRPVIHETAFIYPTATIVGNVTIGRDVYIAPGAVLRGDWGKIVIEDGSNVQENCTIHVPMKVTARLKAGAHIGHGAVIHGATIGRNVLVGMNAVIMDDAEVGDESIVGALCLVPRGMIIPSRKMVVGNPGRIIKDVTDKRIKQKGVGTGLYQMLPSHLHRSLKPCEPLRADPKTVFDRAD